MRQVSGLTLGFDGAGCIEWTSSSMIEVKAGDMVAIVMLGAVSIEPSLSLLKLSAALYTCCQKA